MGSVGEKRSDQCGAHRSLIDSDRLHRIHVIRFFDTKTPRVFKFIRTRHVGFYNDARLWEWEKKLCLFCVEAKLAWLVCLVVSLFVFQMIEFFNFQFFEQKKKNGRTNELDRIGSELRGRRDCNGFRFLAPSLANFELSKSWMNAASAKREYDL